MWRPIFGLVLPWGRTGITTMTGIAGHSECCEKSLMIQFFGLGVVVILKRTGPCPNMQDTADNFAKFLEDNLK